MKYNSIRPGQVWLDTTGKRIHAHGGSIMYIDGVYYWYGENKEKTLPETNIWHWGVRCYTSTDLYNWEDRGLIIPPEPYNPESSLHPESMMDRPHIIYNKRTKKYVCWLKVMEKDDTQTETVLTADHILGPYTKVKERLRPLGMSAGDFDLVVAPDGKAYYYFERVHSETICADLTDDYTDVSGYYSTHFPRVSPPDVREATAHFYRKGLHYLVTSGTTGYFPNPSEVACGKTWHGSFKVLGDPHVNDSSCTSFNSQITSVFKHPQKKDLYIALADRWLPALPEIEGENFKSGASYKRIAKMMNSFFNEENVETTDDIEILLNANTSIADYVWLPFRFDGEKPYLEWKDEWKIEDYE
ncbi:family 43 glycosylhydrolase [Domibacillus robiginosus]|uniref:family 43 glycosylhydrolase n=1 Tax=Domibacillus robiginosus TaxID=1071054 RepID=UPI00067AD209|nr:family 43 glycosylhydrolase [Domibacillus robiginosus]